MNFFGKNKHAPQYFPATCPKCGGNLELSADRTLAICQRCGMQLIVRGALSEKKKECTLDKIIAFFERQQSVYRSDRKAKEQKASANRKKTQQSATIIFIGCFITFIILLIIVAIMAHLEN